MPGPHHFSPYDAPFWASATARRLALQRCTRCGTVRYPPGPACPSCLAPDATWEPLSGQAELLSWTVFHRQYLPAFPAPHTVIVVRLAEGPLLTATITPGTQAGLYVGAPLTLDYDTRPDGTVLPTFRLRPDNGPTAAASPPPAAPPPAG